MKKITNVTGNWAKIDSAKKILEPLGYEIDSIKMDVIVWWKMEFLEPRFIQSIS